jgi:GDPmannose 4,6-dehydratase
MSKANTAFITGIAGQDGSYLAKLLLENGYSVHGSIKDPADSNELWRLRQLGILDQVQVTALNLADINEIKLKFAEIQPSEVYNLAAQSSVGASFKDPLTSFTSDGIYPVNLLEVIRTSLPETKFFQASSGEIFGPSTGSLLDENSTVHPTSPYATAKAFAYFAVGNYREAYKIFACSGIMFNHESTLRAPEFVTKKIALKVAAIAKGDKTPLEIGNMDAKRDWGYAPEYVSAMHLMLTNETADDYIVATGELHSVREFIETAFQVIGKDIVWEGSEMNEIGKDKVSGELLVKVNPEFYRPVDAEALGGNHNKITEKLGWEPKVKFAELVKLLVENELN